MAMKKAKTAPAPLSAEETSELLALTKQADTVELKLTVPETRSGYRSTAAALEIDPLDAQMRQVFFFDTPDLLLNQHGVVVRARRSQGAVDDSVVKLRPVEPAEIAAELRKLPDFGVEVDALPGGFVCSASFKAKLGADRRPRRPRWVSGPCGSCSPRASGRSSPPMPRRASSSTTSASSGR